MVWETAVGCSIQRTLPVALNVCSEESAVDAPASFRVVQGHRTDVCFLCTHPIAERDGQRPLKDTKLWHAGAVDHQGLQEHAGLVRASQLPEDTHPVAGSQAHPI